MTDEMTRAREALEDARQHGKGFNEAYRENLVVDAMLSFAAAERAAAVAQERERCAKVATCAFDDRPRSRFGHHSHMDWEDGYREGTQAAAAAIREGAGA